MSHKMLPEAEKVSALFPQLDTVIVGYPHMKRMVVMAILADSHVLLKSVPGLGKTLMVDVLRGIVDDTDSHAFQMTPDMKPSDILGNRIFNLKSGEFENVPGPIVGKNFVVFDEVNRTTPKTLSASLRAMEERFVLIGNQVYDLEDPFLVLATMNPVEQEGTFPLPEAMLDRFALNIEMTYIDRMDEVELLRRVTVHTRNRAKNLKKVCTKADIIAAREIVFQMSENTTDAIREYIVDLCRATRPEDNTFASIKDAKGKDFGEVIEVGSSPRGEIFILHTASAHAFLSGRDYIIPDDVKYVYKDAIRHRIVPSQRARLANFDMTSYLETVLDQVPVIEDK